MKNSNSKILASKALTIKYPGEGAFFEIQGTIILSLQGSIFFFSQILRAHFFFITAGKYEQGQEIDLP